MHGADEPSERDVVVQGLQTAPRLAARGHVNQREKNSGNDLQQENGERGAAEYIPPACRVSGNGMFDGFSDRRRQLQAVVEPFAQLCNHAHGDFLVASAAVPPGVGNSPA